MERVLPKSINYTDVLPMSVPAVAKRRKYYPNNGPNFPLDGQSQIRIDLASPNSLLDCGHSYLEFEIANNTAQTFGLDSGGAHVCFDTCRIEQGGRVISETQAYNRLHSAVLAPLQDATTGRSTQSVTELQLAGNAGNQLLPSTSADARGDNQAFCRHNADGQVAAGGVVKLTMPITSGLFTQDKLLPLPLLNEPLTIVLTCTAASNIGVWSAGAAPVSTLVVIQRISYVAALVEVGGDVIQQFRQMQSMMGGQLAISGQDWLHNSGTIEAAAQGEQIVRVPARKRSIKSLFWVANDPQFLGNAGGAGTASNLLHLRFNMSYGGTCNALNFQMKVGSVVYPPTPIVLPGNTLGTSPEFQRAEAVTELAKAIGSLAITNNSGSGINTVTYCTVSTTTGAAARIAGGAPNEGLANGDNDDGAAADFAPQTAGTISVAPFGLDLDSFQTQLIQSGIDSETMSEEINLVINTPQDAAGSGLYAKTVHTWCCYDKIYYWNADGSLTFSD